MKHKKQ